jgi:pSer/pThr/pTyr-binding forkhead associated (FHA) protein
MTIKLVSTPLSSPKQKIVLDQLPATLGRSPDAQVRLDDRWVSRVHCRLDEIGGTVVVQDLRSRNGTLVNGSYVTEAHLLPGDQLTVGLTSFEVQYNRGR